MSNGRTIDVAALAGSTATDAARTLDALAPGAHLVTPRLGYTHHGIYVGNGRVIHYAGLSRTLFRGPVEEVSLAEFAGGRRVYVRSPRQGRFSASEIVARARSRLGEDSYRLASNNCEHFCAWCRTGIARSEQVEAVAAWFDRARQVAISLWSGALGARADARAGTR